MLMLLGRLTSRGVVTPRLVSVLVLVGVMVVLLVPVLLGGVVLGFLVRVRGREVGLFDLDAARLEDLLM